MRILHFRGGCTAEAGSALPSCLLQPFRLTFTRSGLAGGSWWLPGVTLSFGHCRSDHIKRAGPGQGQKDASPPGSAFKEGFRAASVQKQPGSSRSAWNHGRLFLVRFGRLPSSLHLHPAPTLPPPPGPEAVAELDWRMMLLLRESLHQRRGRRRREPRERGRERVGRWVVVGGAQEECWLPGVP